MARETAKGDRDPGRGERLPIRERDEHGRDVDRLETFREMIDRCIRESDGSIILHDGAE
jgi:hypothetical protein